jgi:prolipoprotein diacylglyceryltransferase
VAGSLFFTYLVLGGVERLFIEFLRLNQKYIFGLSGAQLIALVMIGIGTWFLTHPIVQPEESPSE